MFSLPMSKIVESLTLQNENSHRYQIALLLTNSSEDSFQIAEILVG